MKKENKYPENLDNFEEQISKIPEKYIKNERGKLVVNPDYLEYLEQNDLL